MPLAKFSLRPRIGFSRTSYFNDPFDKPVATPVATDNPVSGMVASFGSKIKGQIWEKNTAVLSLTRSSNNALMWAHYADGHRGAVLEINAAVAGFVDVEKNMVPAQFGSVIYSRTRLMEQYHTEFDEGIVVGGTHRFVLGHYEKWQQLFLTKPLEWAYEEEVRVIKCIEGLSANGNSFNVSGDCTIIEVHERPLHCFRIPRSSIRRILFGARADETDSLKIAQEHQDIPTCRSVLCDASFSVEFSPFR